MSKKKKQSKKLEKTDKHSKIEKEIIQFEDCSKNEECAVSVIGEIRVIVFYNGPNYKVKIAIPRRSITSNIIKVQNSKFDLYLHFKDTNINQTGGNLNIQVTGKYKSVDRAKKPSECKEIKLGISNKRYYGNITLQPEFFIPEKWASSVSSLEDEIAYRHYKRDIRRMELNPTNYTNYEKNNAHHPFQGGDCTGGK